MSQTENHTLKKSKTAFRTISEVSKEVEVAQHVLRFWETKFPEIQPIKRGGGRRYYRVDDITLIKTIKTLLYEERYTIEGVQKLFKEKGVKNIIDDSNSGFFANEFLAPTVEEHQKPSPIETTALNQEKINNILSELQSLRNYIRTSNV
ncbi:MAG: MerR family transcriptional regulator [Alphaproteobacteria bacterium]